MRILFCSRTRNQESSKESTGDLQRAMKLTIDNLDGSGPRDYTAFLDASKSARVVRKLNSPAELQFGLVTGAGDFVVPVLGARVMLGQSNGSDVFTGYVAQAPSYQYLGWTEQGPIYRYEVVARSDAMLLNEKAPPPSPPFVGRSAGDALRQLSENALRGGFDYGAVEAGDVIPSYSVDPAKKWYASAEEIAVLGRCRVRDANGKLLFGPVGETCYTLDELAGNFCPSGLQLKKTNRIVNDVTIIGQVEPGAHVKDYFVGDGYTTRFYLSQVPFTRARGNTRISIMPTTSRTILDEQYVTLDRRHWLVSDPQNAISVASGKLQVAGGTGVDGQTVVNFIEKIELSGATVLEHGDFEFTAASDGVIGGLYAGAVSIAGCLAGFRVTGNGVNCNLQALVGGAVTGTVMATLPGHHYQLTTRMYASEVYRTKQMFHSSGHPAGAARGGEAIAVDVRVVLEVHDIDPANPGTWKVPATVLYDDVIANAPGYCTYALINAGRMQCSTTYTLLGSPINALIRSTPDQQATRTRREGGLLEGADCKVTESGTLEFYPEYAPGAKEFIEVHYRGRSRARARVMDPVSVEAHRRGADDGVHGAVRQVALPVPCTSSDCEQAALALLDDAGEGWAGEYQAWSPFLPGGAADIFPGDGLQVNAPSQAAQFLGIVSEVEVELRDPAGENSRYRLRFVDAGDPSLGFKFETVTVYQTTPLAATEVSAVGTMYLPDLMDCVVTGVTSTSVTVDAGFAPGVGDTIEVRFTDEGWGLGNDRNLAGRFTVRSFTLPRFSGHTQDYFLRRYDDSTPPKYSRCSGALHVDYPL